jgi:hypothetical protein
MVERDEGRFRGISRSGMIKWVMIEWVMIKWVMRGLVSVSAKAIGTTSILSILYASCANTTSITNV